MEAIGNIEWDADTAKHPKQVKNTLNKLRTRRQKAVKEGACRGRALSAPTHSFTNCGTSNLSKHMLNFCWSSTNWDYHTNLQEVTFMSVVVAGREWYDVI